MYLPSGTVPSADMAAGPARQQHCSDHPLVAARPLLFAIAFWQILERGRPLVAARCIFQMWKVQVARWRQLTNRLVTDISRKDGAEARVPLVLNSRTSAASFACVEQLGVTPPPIGGWVPREGDDERHAEEGTQWWSNMRTKEWIYHSTEDKYFHIPSNSLWERRDTDCCDPAAAPHTFCRVDAVHLQALSHFAKSMDAALIPMAWKAWVRYMKKRAWRHRRQAQPASPPAMAPSPSASSSLAKLHKEAPPSLAPLSEERQPGPDAAAGACPSCGDSAAQPLLEEDDAETRPSEGRSDVLSAAAAGIEKLVADKKAAALISKATPPSTADSSDVCKVLRPHESDEDSLLGTRLKAWCLCFRMRGRWGKVKCHPSDGSESVSPSMMTSESFAHKSTLGCGSNGGGSTRNSGRSTLISSLHEDLHEPSPKGKPPEILDRHTRKLELFLTEVKRNPNRLSQHVDKRRNEKTELAFTVF